MSKLVHIQQFAYHLKRKNYSEETIYNYKRDLEVFSNFLKIQDVKFKNIDKNLVVDYKNYLISGQRRTSLNKASNQRLSIRSINRLLSSLRAYLKFLSQKGYKPSVSADIVRLIRIKYKKVPIVKLGDQIRLIESPSRYEKNKKIALRNRAMLETLFSTGMRISELVSIKQSQIDKTGKIFIRDRGKKERFVYLTPRAQRHLENYLRIRGNIESPYIFIPFQGKNLHKKDKKISPNYLQERVKRYRELLGLKMTISCHSIRHAFANYLAESEANPEPIKTVQTHESINTTTRYVHASDKYTEKMHKKYHPLKE